MTASATSPRRRIAGWFHRHPRAGFGLQLSGPAGWLLVVYIGSLFALVVTSLFRLVDDPTGLVTRLDTSIHLTNFDRLISEPVYRNIALRTFGAALLVTVIDAIIALPVAFFMAKVVSKRWQRALVISMTLPLWAGYLVKGYAWRALLAPEGGAFQAVFGYTPGYGYKSAVIVLAYLWFPFMVIPLYAGFARLPNSLLEASTDLGAKTGRTFVSVVLPQIVPSLIAGSIFTFSLTLGDFFMNRIVGGTNEFIGNVIYRQFSVDLPFAAAYAIVPILIMIGFLLIVSRTGALDEL